MKETLRLLLAAAVSAGTVFVTQGAREAPAPNTMANLGLR